MRTGALLRPTNTKDTGDPTRTGVITPTPAFGGGAATQLTQLLRAKARAGTGHELITTEWIQTLDAE